MSEDMKLETTLDQYLIDIEDLLDNRKRIKKLQTQIEEAQDGNFAPTAKRGILNLLNRLVTQNTQQLNRLADRATKEFAEAGV